MNKLIDIFNLFRKGSAVANPEAWKDAGNMVMLVTPILLLVVKIAGDFGYGLELSTDEATKIAGGIVVFVQFIIHNISSDKAGILPAKVEPAPESPDYRG